jgi:hypothetical protein
LRLPADIRLPGTEYSLARCLRAMHEHILYAAVGVLIALTLALGYSLYVTRNADVQLSGAMPASTNLTR